MLKIGTLVSFCYNCTYIISHSYSNFPHLISPINACNSKENNNINISIIDVSNQWNIYRFMIPLPSSWVARALFSIPRILLMASNSNCSANFCLTRFFTNLSQYSTGNDLKRKPFYKFKSRHRNFKRIRTLPIWSVYPNGLSYHHPRVVLPNKGRRIPAFAPLPFPFWK